MRTIATRVLTRLSKQDEGQGLAEYALVLALIAVISIVALMFLSGSVRTILSTVGDTL